MRCVFCLLLLIALLVAPSQGGAITVIGASSCGSWISARKVDSAEAKKAWVLGFLSGAAAGTKRGVIDYVDAESVWLYIDNFCEANPLKSTDDAAIALFVEVAKEKGL